MNFPWASKPKYFACSEYWVYLPRAKVPPQNAYMQRMLKLNPFDNSLAPPVGASEAILFSDIRLHMALVLREKNAHAFRPDLFESHIVPDSKLLETLGQSEAFLKVQYLSTERLRDDRHLRFMPYLAESVGALGRAGAVFDPIAELLQPFSEFQDVLKHTADTAAWEYNVRLVWLETEMGGIGVTRGMVKAGLPELQTPESAADHRVLILDVLAEASRQLWHSRTLEQSLAAESFGDRFELEIKYARKGPATARIRRLHT